MQKQIEDLKRRAEQGSQQLQGEVQELELENRCAQNFLLMQLNRYPKANLAAMCCTVLSVQAVILAAPSCGSSNVPRTGAMPGW
ncbi:DUF2130 domain-containing protein [Methylobacter svalbardensis]|uniref:DUF2130 domain-containing protein n=1 Tax=Methylobacter svalbardensis TaxID=3080016 RepID=UPI0030EEDC29